MAILDAETATSALQVVRDVVAELPLPELIGVRCARTLLIDSCERVGLVPSERVGDEVQGLVDTLLAHSGPPSLFGGLGEVGWVVDHVAGGDTADLVCAPIDAALLATIDVDAWTGDYDLISGLVGIGLYALARLHVPAGTAIASKVLAHLERMASSDGSWLTPTALLPEWARDSYPDGQINLGVAHGMPGIAGLTSRYIAAGFEAARARAVLETSVEYLLAAVPRQRPRFPAALAPGKPPGRGERLAWCYGDLGISVVLLGCARVTDRASWEREAIDLALASTDRAFPESGVIDAGLCHGAAGAGHLFHRLFRATGEQRFAVAARRWLQKTIELRRPGEGIGGFVSPFTEDGRDVWREDPTLLTGASGTALALLAAATDVDPGWDRLMLCDVS